MSFDVPKRILRELIETGTVPPSKRDSFNGKPIPVSIARAVIEGALSCQEPKSEKRFGAVGKKLQRLPDGTIAFLQTFEHSLGTMKEHKQLFSDLRQAIDAFLKAREKDFPEIPYPIRFDWNA